MDSRITVLLAPAALVAELLLSPIVRPMRDITLEASPPLLPLLATMTSLLTLTERPPPERLERIVPIARPNELDLMVVLPLLRDIDERDGVLLLR